MHPYHSPYEHVLDELERMFWLVECAIRRQWATPGLQHRLDPSLSRALGVTDIEDIETQRHRLAELGEQIEQHGAVVRERAALSRTGAGGLPLVELRRAFDLDDFQMDILLLTLAPELDPRFATLFGYLQRDRGRRSIDVCLVSDVLCTNAWLRGRLFGDLWEQGALRRQRLVDLLPSDVGMPTSLLYRPLQINPALVEYVLARPLASSAYETVHPPGGRLADLVYDDAVAEMVPHLERCWTFGPDGPVAILTGRVGVGKRSLVRATCAELGVGVIELDAAALPTDPRACARVVRTWLLRGILYRSLCYAVGVEELAGEADERGADPRVVLLTHHLESHPGPVAIGSTRGLQHLRFGRRVALHVSVRMPAKSAREHIWHRELRQAGLWLPPEQVRALAGTFHVSGGTVHEAVLVAARTVPDGPTRPIHHAKLERVVGGIVSSRLSKLAQRVDRLATWDDLVAADDLVARIRGLVARHRHRERVLDTWGFGPRLHLVTGVTALFWGPPGTGKSMTAGIIARELGFEIYQVDLAMVMSKWLGETEKNLAQIFDEAESGRIILLFDEADSLFSKRTSDSDTPQSQALSQRVNYILTRLERFHGTAILTSNRETAIDDAFERRMSAKILFPLPDEERRAILWRRMLGGQAPPDDGLIELLAQCELAGGHIRNVCATAAFSAAGDGRTVDRFHLCGALIQMLQDMGRIAPSWLREYA